MFAIVEIDSFLSITREGAPGAPFISPQICEFSFVCTCCSLRILPKSDPELEEVMPVAASPFPFLILDPQISHLKSCQCLLVSCEPCCLLLLLFWKAFLFFLRRIHVLDPQMDQLEAT